MSTTRNASLAALASPAPRQDEFLALGPVELRVTDADRAARFWQEVIGLRPLATTAEAIILGTAQEPLIVLRETASRGAVDGHSGLYHVAVHHPSEREFGRALARLAQAAWPASPVDHLFSKAIYLRDPDGIGVELTLETPWRMRELRVDAARGLHAIDQEGGTHRPSEPLDVPTLLRAAEGLDAAAPADGAYIGHVHLTVPDLGAAVGFYRDQLGMVGHLDEPGIGFADLHAGGAFTHRIALNTFHGPGAAPTPVEAAGLDRFTIRFATRDRLAQARARLEEAGAIAEADDRVALRVQDPAGDAIDLIA
jgi:catechol 2,3-dioxygenase